MTDADLNVLLTSVVTELLKSRGSSATFLLSLSWGDQHNENAEVIKMDCYT